jgi:hypothetical protein
MKMNDEEIKQQLHSFIKENVEGPIRANQPHSPSLSVASYKVCDNTLEYLVIPMEGTNRLDIIQLVKDIQSWGLPGVGLDVQSDSDAQFQFYIHAPWRVRNEPPPPPQQDVAPRRFNRAPVVKPSFSAVRLQTWFIGVLITVMFALAKGPYLGI